jgi:hypothetical protein
MGRIAVIRRLKTARSRHDPHCHVPSVADARDQQGDQGDRHEIGGPRRLHPQRHRRNTRRQITQHRDEGVEEPIGKIDPGPIPAENPDPNASRIGQTSETTGSDQKPSHGPMSESEWSPGCR